MAICSYSSSVGDCSSRLLLLLLLSLPVPTATGVTDSTPLLLLLQCGSMDVPVPASPPIPTHKGHLHCNPPGLTQPKPHNKSPLHYHLPSQLHPIHMYYSSFECNRNAPIETPTIGIMNVNVNRPLACSWHGWIQ